MRRATSRGSPIWRASSFASRSMRTPSARAPWASACTDGWFEKAFATIGREHDDALMVEQAVMFNEHRSRIVELAAKGHLPAMYGLREFVDAGGLMYYGASLQEMYYQAAALVDKLLRGAKPGDLPIEQPTRFELLINLKAAKPLGLTIPRSLLLRADHVIE